MDRVLRRVAVAVAGCVAIALGAIATPAVAADSQALVLSASTVTYAAPDGTKGTAGTSAAHRVTSLTPAEKALVGSNGQTLGAAVAAGTVYYRTWWQTASSSTYVAWNEKHVGLFYFDGGTVWQNDYAGYNSGYHQCDINNGIGFTVVNKGCPTYGDPNTYRIQAYDYYQVSFLFKGLPLTHSSNMHGNFYNSGSTYFHWASYPG